MENSKNCILDWYVFIVDNNKIVVENLFNLSKDFNILFNSAVKDYQRSGDVQKFVEEVERALFYAFRGKFEYEVCIKPLSNYGDELKVDIHSQIRLNWNRFITYIITELGRD